MTVLNGIHKENNMSSDDITFLSQNPFIHKLELDNSFDKIKTAILTVLLLPFRVICICLLLILAWILACIGLYGLSFNELRSKPLTGWRRSLRNMTAYTMRGFFWAGSFHYIKVKGERASKKLAPVIVCAPHSSFFDAIICIYLMAPAVVAKAETNALPILGKLINYTQPIYVWRDDPNSRQNTIKSIIDRANSEEDWPQILIFPEGTCTNRSCLITFKPGAFYPAVPIQPVCIRYPNKLDTVTWTWEGPGAMKLLWLTLTQVHSSCEIEFLPVYNPSEEEKLNPKLYAYNVRNVMAKALNIPVSEYTYDHCKLMNRCKLMNNPYASEIVNVEKLRRNIGLHLTNIEEQVVTLVNDNNCNVTLIEFSLRLQVASDPATSALFSLFDKDNSGVIDFREYLLCALFLIKSSDSTINLLLYVFKMYENSGIGPGRVTKNSLYLALKNTIASTQEEANEIFTQIDKENRGFITFDEFLAYAEKKTEFSKLFTNSDYHPDKKQQ